jgi:exopolysaccharide biosynthesis polyprenyl glycosylphosphotransferase
VLRRFSVDFALFSIILDMVCVAISLSLASLVRPYLNTFPFVTYIPQPIVTPWALYLIFPILWVAILSLLSLYDNKRNYRFSTEITNLTVGSMLSAIALAGTLYLSYRDVSRILFLNFILFGYLFMLIWRVFFRLSYKAGFFNNLQARKVLIIGAGVVGRELEGQINAVPLSRLKIIGFLDDDPSKVRENSGIIGPLENARSLVKQYEIDDVVFALPMRAYDKVNSLVGDLHDLPIKIWVIPDYFSLALHKAKIDEIAGIPMLDLRAPALTELQRLVKRVFDLIISMITSILLLPILGLIALAIQLDSQGPILYRQERVGENGRLFNMLKFRTMVVNADQLVHLAEWTDDHGNIIHKRSDDPRITRVGKFLRRFSLDELPQLINILKGEMSIVGPRPELPSLVEKYQPWQRTRFAVPQGLTGWWQINGRSDKPMHLNTEDDIFYVQNYSILLDLQIMLKTIWVVLKGQGAY